MALQTIIEAMKELAVEEPVVVNPIITPYQESELVTKKNPQGKKKGAKNETITRKINR